MRAQTTDTLQMSDDISSPDEEIVDESTLSPEEMSAAAMLGINTKRLSKKAYAALKEKAQQQVKEASTVVEDGVRRTVQGELPGGARYSAVRGGGVKSAEKSASVFAKADPSLAFPTKEVAEAAGDAAPSSVAGQVESAAAKKLATAETPLFSRLLSSGSVGRKVAAGLFGSIPGSVALGLLTPTETSKSADFPYGAGRSTPAFADDPEYKALYQKQADAILPFKKYLDTSNLDPFTKAQQWDEMSKHYTPEKLHERASKAYLEYKDQVKKAQSKIDELDSQILSETNPYRKEELVRKKERISGKLETLSPIPGAAPSSTIAGSPTKEPLPPGATKGPDGEVYLTPNPVPSTETDIASLDEEEKLDRAPSSKVKTSAPITKASVQAAKTPAPDQVAEASASVVKAPDQVADIKESALTDKEIAYLDDKASSKMFDPYSDSDKPGSAEVDAMAAVAQEESNYYKELLKRYDEAKAQQEERIRMANILQGISQIGAGISRTQPKGAEFYDMMRKQAESGLVSFKERAELEAEARSADPTSVESKTYRNLLKEQGIAVPDTVSAAFIKKQYPQFTSVLARREEMEAKAAARKEDIEAKAVARKEAYEANALARREAIEDRKLARQEAAKDRAVERALRQEELSARRDELGSQRADKDFVSMSNKLTGELASSRSAFGRGANIIRSAEAIEALAAGMDPKEIDLRQITEIARNLDSMLSQGAATISGTKKLIPSSFTGDISKIAEYITSRPKGAGQQEFVKRLLETVSREKELAKTQITRTQKKILSGFEHLKTRYPDRYARVLEEHGIPTGEEPAPSAPAPALQEKVVVEKDGKRFRLPRSQLDRAIKQGYKAVE